MIKVIETRKDENDKVMFRIEGLSGWFCPLSLWAMKHIRTEDGSDGPLKP